MAKRKKKKLEAKRLEERTAFYTMISSLAVPIGALLGIIEWALKHFLK